MKKILSYISEYALGVIAITLSVALAITLVAPILQQPADRIVSQVSNQNLGGVDPQETILVGSSPATFVRFPSEFVFADSTTTDDLVNIGNATSTGGTVNQLVITDSYTDYTIYADLRGGTATSTACIRPMWSFDNDNYYGLSAHATSTQLTGTTTPTLANQVVCVDPGTSTTTWAFTGSIPAAKSARFLIWGEEKSTDPSDGVEGHITITLEDKSGK